VGLVFREIPGELVQGCRDAERFRRWWGLDVALVDAVGCAVAGVSRSPVCLGFPAPGGLTSGATTGSLASAYSRIRIEPSQADPTGAFSGVRACAGLPGGQLLASRGGQFLASAEGRIGYMDEVHVYFRVLGIWLPKHSNIFPMFSIIWMLWTESIREIKVVSAMRWY
jgi:hypothetical protein